jgi:hypothetical protein
MICDRITPELPRAPISAPCDMHAIIGPAVSSLHPFNSARTDRIVKDMLVPVSPSGTGKTLMAFTCSTW